MSYLRFLFFGTFVYANTLVLALPERCKQPAVAGPCLALFHRFYFNAETYQCEEFIYGGCGGNENNFMDKASCEQTCKNNVCTLPKESGPCDALFPRYFFNTETYQCEEFVYGGCGGNKNNFQDKISCQKLCQSGSYIY